VKAVQKVSTVSLAISLLAVGVAAGVFLRSQPATPRPAPAALSDRLGAEAELNALKRDLDQLRATTRDLQARAQMAADAPPAPSSAVDTRAVADPSIPTPLLLPEEQQQLQKEADQAHAKQLQALEQRLQNEPKDRAWTEQVKAVVDAAGARPEMSGSTIQALDCRTTLCRMEVSHAEEASQQRFWGTVGADFPIFGSGTLSHKENPDGTVVTVAYFTRADQK
jgi:flagellar motor protein MotB